MSIHLSYIAGMVMKSFDTLSNEIKLSSSFMSNDAYKLSNHVTNVVDEVTVINGKELVIRRVFVHTSDSGNYESVGWVLASDVKHCMICSQSFGYFTYQHYCLACGNIVCQKCSSNEALIFEIQHLGLKRVCDQCYWGQEMVYALHRTETNQNTPMKANTSSSSQVTSPSFNSPAPSTPTYNISMSHARDLHGRIDQIHAHLTPVANTSDNGNTPEKASNGLQNTPIWTLKSHRSPQNSSRMRSESGNNSNFLETFGRESVQRDSFASPTAEHAKLLEASEERYHQTLLEEEQEEEHSDDDSNSSRNSSSRNSSSSSSGDEDEPDHTDLSENRNNHDDAAYSAIPVEHDHHHLNTELQQLQLSSSQSHSRAHSRSTSLSVVPFAPVMHLEFLERSVRKPRDMVMHEYKLACIRREANGIADGETYITNVVSEITLVNLNPVSVHRIFATSIDSGEYSEVGWVLFCDVQHCMICSQSLNAFVAGHHCFGCGNIVCGSCSGSEGVVYELQSLGPKRVCTQCYWGQELVYALHREHHNASQDTDIHTDNAAAALAMLAAVNNNGSTINNYDQSLAELTPATVPNTTESTVTESNSTRNTAEEAEEEEVESEVSATMATEALESLPVDNSEDNSSRSNEEVEPISGMEDVMNELDSLTTRPSVVEPETEHAESATGCETETTEQTASPVATPAKTPEHKSDSSVHVPFQHTPTPVKAAISKFNSPSHNSNNSSNPTTPVNLKHSAGVNISPSQQTYLTPLLRNKNSFLSHQNNKNASSTTDNSDPNWSTPVSRPVPTKPPKMHGWLKKRGHIVQKWKSRYFVLDNGYFSYYVDKLDGPPFGKGLKGQLCLAGYREKEIDISVPATENTSSTNSGVDSSSSSAVNDVTSSNNSSSSSSAGSASSPAAKSPPPKFERKLSRRVSFRATSQGNGSGSNWSRVEETVVLLDEEDEDGVARRLCRIHLATNALTGFSNGVLQEDPGDDQFLSRESESATELLLEAFNQEDRAQWSAAIQAHTQYIEAILQTEQAANVLLSTPLGAIEQQQLQHQQSQQQVPAPPADRSPMRLVTTGKVNNIINSYHGGGTGVFYKKQQEIKQLNSSSNTSSSGGSSSPAVPRTPSTIITANSAANHKRLAIFLKDDETLLLSGLVTKPNSVGIPLMRELLWTSLNRLLYIDPKTLELKGEIRWVSHEPHPKLKQVDKSTFEVVDCHRKVFKFISKDATTAATWIETIETAVNVF